MDTLDRSCEPMDIDLSSGTLDALNCSTKKIESHESIAQNSINNVFKNCGNKIDVVTPDIGLKKTRKLYVNKEKCNKNKTGLTGHRNIKKGFKSLAICAFSGCVSVLVCVYFGSGIHCVNLNVTCEIHELLISRLYGQAIPIDNIVDTFTDKSPQKLVFIYGSTGVGKTYAVSTMLKGLWNYSNIYHYTMPSFTTVIQNTLMSGLIMCPHSTIIVDDLTTEDMNIQSNIIELFEKSSKLAKELTIVLIYNCDITIQGFRRTCDDNFYINLDTAFANVNVAKYYIRFNKLTRGDLKKCIENELKQLQYVGNASIDDFIHNFDVTFDGCKSVHRKIRSLISHK